jgi:hypothetical protein
MAIAASTTSKAEEVSDQESGAVRQTDHPALRLGALAELLLPQQVQRLALMALRRHSLVRRQLVPHYHLAPTAQGRRLRGRPVRYQQSSASFP